MFNRLKLIIITIGILGLFALSFNLLFGYTGLLSFGHGTYFAMGAYVCGYLLKHSVPSNQRFFWQWLATWPLFSDTLVERQLNLWHLLIHEIKF